MELNEAFLYRNLWFTMCESWVNKLKQSHADEILNEFDKDDLKGLYDVRTYIAHDYEGVNLAIIEWIIRFGLPKFKEQCLKVIDKPI